MGCKSINGLMKHLRDNGIAIKGSTQKRQLINTGYYHGYNITTQFGYRDDTGRLRGILCDYVLESMQKNHRWGRCYECF